jgi:hypothetical protein
MVLTAIALLLSIVGVAVFPCWRYSARWGYVPSAIAALLLIGVSILSLGGRATTSDTLTAKFVAGAQVALADPPRRGALTTPDVTSH